VELKHVFTPITISGLEIKNRIQLSPLGLGYADDNYSTDRFLAFYEERAKGGAGLISWALWPYATEHGYFPAVYRDDFIPGLKRVVDVVHKHGAKIVGQLGTGYGWAFKGKPVEIVGPSGISLIKRPSTPFRVGTPTAPERLTERAITIDEIHEMADGYVEASRRIRDAGFDGVEIMLASGYTLSRFMSPETNKRTDEYGGSLENRLRILRDITSGIKKKVGSDFRIFSKISPASLTKDGYTLQECADEIVPRLVDMGICAFNVAVGWHEAPGVMMLGNAVKQGQFINFAETIKKNTKVPIIHGTRINDLKLADAFIAEGKMDMVSLGRQLIVDPEAPNKAKAGNFDDIKPCICCCWCLETVDTPVICSVNPRVSHEFEYTVEPAKKPKRILVVGGGPGGIEAALTAARRGHKVILAEKEDNLGGALVPASTAPFKDDTKAYVEYIRRQVAKSNVELRLGKDIHIEDVLEIAPDAVIVATGGKPIIPNIQNIIRGNVVLAVDVLKGKRDVGSKVVIVGGGMVGCETAEYLFHKGKKVIMLEMLPRIANDVVKSLRFDVITRLRKAGIQMETNVEVKRISEHGVWGLRRGFDYGPNDVFFEADTVVLAVGTRADNPLAKELEGKIPVRNVGDCSTPGKIKDAVSCGFLAGKDI